MTSTQNWDWGGLRFVIYLRILFFQRIDLLLIVKVGGDERSQNWSIIMDVLNVEPLKLKHLIKHLSTYLDVLRETNQL